MMFAHACLAGWIATAFPLLQSEDTPLESGPITVEQTSWLGSLMPLGAVVGTFLYGFIAGWFGIRWTMMLLCIPSLIFWLGIIFGTTIEHLLLVRFIAGLTAGGINVCSPLFLADVAENKYDPFHVQFPFGSLLIDFVVEFEGA